MTKSILEFFIRRSTHLNRHTRERGYSCFSYPNQYMDTRQFVPHFWYDEVNLEFSLGAVHISTVILANAGIHVSVILTNTWIPDSSFLTSGMTKWIIEFFIRRNTHLNRHTRERGYPCFSYLN